MEQQGSLFGSLLPLIVLFAIFYFLIIRPQQKTQKAHRQMLTDLTKGDKIITTGGLMVEISKVEDDFFTVKNSDETTMKLSKSYVASKI